MKSLKSWRYQRTIATRPHWPSIWPHVRPALWAERAAGLDHVWEVTRPAEPTAQVWGALWGRVLASLDLSVAKGVESSALEMPSQNGSPATASIRSVSPRPEPSRFRRQNWALIGLVGAAQAAAVLLAAGLAWNHFAKSNSTPTAQIAKSVSSASVLQTVARDGKLLSLPAVDVEEGSLVVIVIPATGEKPMVVDRTPEWMFFGVDDWYLVYNAVEALANPVVAMKE